MNIPRRLRFLVGSNKGIEPQTDREDEQVVQPVHKAVLGWVKEIATILVIAILLSFLIKTFLFRAFYIPSGSMENTLQIGDRVFVNLLVPNPISLKRGDVVVFKDTQGWLGANSSKSTPIESAFTFLGLAPDNSSEYLIKRVIGLPGDHVICCDDKNRLMINGKSIDEPYLKAGSNNAFGVNSLKFDVVVPPNKIWVMGDNRNNSADSRFHQDSAGKGFVPTSDVVGRAAVIAWPVTHWDPLSNYPDTFDGLNH